MFGSKKKESTASNTNKGKMLPSSTPSINSLVEGTFVEGTIRSESDIRIDGSVKGTLNCKAKVIIGPTGVFNGEINCQNSMIEGSFQGKLNVKDHLQIQESAKIEGEINTDQLSVQPGAIFNVSCEMNNQVTAKKLETKANATVGAKSGDKSKAKTDTQPALADKKG
ncbi:MAG TPA: polymer-forming cytoskeletal protein [Saprospiraceae bacterium]|nr:polymer-forming cytoskeletal protein [Saprospiraceae bacterium]